MSLDTEDNMQLFEQEQKCEVIRTTTKHNSILSEDLDASDILLYLEAPALPDRAIPNL